MVRIVVTSFTYHWIPQKGMNKQGSVRSRSFPRLL